MKRRNHDHARKATFDGFRLKNDRKASAPIKVQPVFHRSYIHRAHRLKKSGFDAFVDPLIHPSLWCGQMNFYNHAGHDVFPIVSLSNRNDNPQCVAIAPRPTLRHTGHVYDLAIELVNLPIRQRGKNNNRTHPRLDITYHGLSNPDTCARITENSISDNALCVHATPIGKRQCSGKERGCQNNTYDNQCSKCLGERRSYCTQSVANLPRLYGFFPKNAHRPSSL